MRIMILAALASIPFATTIAPAPAVAWSKYGHLIICDLAYRNSTAATRDELKGLFRTHSDGARAGTRAYRSFNYACLEEDERPRRRPSEHFTNYPRDQAAVTGPTCPPGRNCILGGIESDAAILAGRSAPRARRAAALMSVGHWVGDVHQPLHVSFGDDAGGNSIVAVGACATTNLHAVWDKCLLERRVFKRVPAKRAGVSRRSSIAASIAFSKWRGATRRS